jgi:phage gp16-like protein
MNLHVADGHKMIDTEHRHRNQMIAKIHIAIKEAMICPECRWLQFMNECQRCGCKTRKITDEDYRYFLSRITHKRSCKAMSMDELSNVLDALYDAGFIPISTVHIYDLNAKKTQMIKHVEELAQTIMGNNWRKRLDGWVRKVFGVDSMKFLTSAQLRAVFAFLHKLENKEAKRWI